MDSGRQVLGYVRIWGFPCFEFVLVRLWNFDSRIVLEEVAFRPDSGVNF